MINLTDLKAKAEAATPGEWTQGDPWDPWWVNATDANGVMSSVADTMREGDEVQGKADAAYIAAASPAAMLPLINALIEWRDAYQAWSSADSAARLGLASDALFALIGGEPTQETTP